MIAPIVVRLTKIIIGSGGSLSATWGAKIVKTLAKKLQNPRAVAQKRVGKISTVAIYTITNAPAIPNLARITKNGIQKRYSAPRNRMQIPPTDDNAKRSVNESLIPNFPYKYPPRATATSSEPPLANALLYMFPGKYLS